MKNAWKNNYLYIRTEFTCGVVKLCLLIESSTTVRKNLLFKRINRDRYPSTKCLDIMMKLKIRAI